MHSLVQKILGTCERVANIFLHPGANYTYMYNLHTVCKSAHVNGALEGIYGKERTQFPGKLGVHHWTPSS